MLNTRKFENLLPSEIKRVERFASLRDNKDCRVTGFSYTSTLTDPDWAVVRCEVCSNNMEDRENDVVIYVFLPDRRRSFISKALSL